MKLAIFKYATQFGGGEKYTELMCNGLNQEGISTTLISNYAKLIKACKADGKIFCRHLPEAKTRKEMALLLCLWPFEVVNYLIIALRLRMSGYRSILLQDLNDKLILTPLCRLFGIKVYWIEHTNWRPHLIAHPFFRLLKISGQLSSAIICPSSQLGDQVKVINNLAKKVQIIPHGVPKTTAQAHNSSTNIVSISRLSPEKGIDLLIAAMAMAEEEVQVKIFGEGPERRSLEDLSRRLETKVTFAGHVDSPYSQISPNDIFVLPSRVENFPLSILEALSAGLIVVAPRIGGVPEILSGSDNFLFTPGSKEDLHKKINLAINLNQNEHQRIRKANQKIWETRYNINRMVRDTIRTIFGF